jgi:hypothetical protein
LYVYYVCSFTELNCEGLVIITIYLNLLLSEIDVSLPVVLVVLQLEFEVDADTPATGTLRISGYIRSRVLSVNQLVCNLVGT